MNFTETAWKVFNQAIEDYHVSDDVNTLINNPFEKDTLERILYDKSNCKGFSFCPVNLSGEVTFCMVPYDIVQLYFLLL